MNMRWLQVLELRMAIGTLIGIMAVLFGGLIVGDVPPLLSLAFFLGAALGSIGGFVYTAVVYWPQIDNFLHGSETTVG